MNAKAPSPRPCTYHNRTCCLKIPESPIILSKLTSLHIICANYDHQQRHPSETMDECPSCLVLNLVPTVNSDSFWKFVRLLSFIVSFIEFSYPVARAKSHSVIQNRLHVYG